MDTQTLRDSYEQTPYHAGVHWETHPDTLAATATLLGIDAPPVPTCRVLEIGCATGGNLIPMAATLPQAHFVGIDLSPRQVEMAQRIASALGLTNLTLEAMDLMDLGERFGSFDYIICHGIYCWVPPAVRLAISELCRRLLSPSGIAYISYNTLPGWHLRGIARDMMAFHAGHFSDPTQKVAETRKLMAAMEKAVGDRDSIYGRLIADEAKDIAEAEEYYLLHEHLDGLNNPFHFHEFQAQMAAAGLTWLCESGIQHSALGRHAAPVEKAINELSTDPLDREQYLDFLINRMFRRSLVCRQEAIRSRALCASALPKLRFSAALVITPSKDDPSTQEYKSHTGKAVTTNHPLLRAMLSRLAQAWPATLAFGDLVQLPGQAPPQRSLESLLMQCICNGLIQPHCQPVEAAAALSERPRAFEYARRQADDGLTTVTNLRHRSAMLEGIDSAVLALLDGTRTIPQIVGELAQAVRTGQIEAAGPANDAELLQGLHKQAEHSLQRILRSALLVS